MQKIFESIKLKEQYKNFLHMNLPLAFSETSAFPAEIIDLCSDFININKIENNLIDNFLKIDFSPKGNARSVLIKLFRN